MLLTLHIWNSRTTCIRPDTAITSAAYASASLSDLNSMSFLALDADQQAVLQQMTDQLFNLYDQQIKVLSDRAMACCARDLRSRAPYAENPALEAFDTFDVSDCNDPNL